MKYMLPSTLDQYLYRTWQIFNTNFGSLRLFGEQIAQIADRLDRQSVGEMAEVLADVFDDPQEEVEAELLEFLPSLDDLDLYPNFAEQPDVREAFELFTDRHFKARVLQWSMENPRKSYMLAQAWVDYFSQPPAHGLLLRRGTLVSLVGTWEIFLEALFFGYYFYVDADNQSINSDFREQAASQSVRNAMRGDWRQRIEKFSKLGVDIGIVKDHLDELVEIIKRRNVIVHNAGVIDAKYIEDASPVYQPAEAKEGLMLVVSTHYLMRAFDVVLLIAFGLGQACWRQWQPDKSKKQANRATERLIYQTLRQKRHTLLQELACCTGRMNLPWRNRQLVLVNHAIALRELGDNAAMTSILSELMKKKRDWRTNIALAVLREDFFRARMLLKQAAEKGKLREISPYWPLFDPVREDSWFEAIFNTAERSEVPKRRK